MSVIQFVDENCRWCGAPSKPMHPGGVMSGLWKCYECLRWQQEDPDERAFNELMQEPAFNQVEEL